MRRSVACGTYFLTNFFFLTNLYIALVNALAVPVKSLAKKISKHKTFLIMLQRDFLIMLQKDSIELRIFLFFFDFRNQNTQKTYVLAFKKLNLLKYTIKNLQQKYSYNKKNIQHYFHSKIYKTITRSNRFQYRFGPSLYLTFTNDYISYLVTRRYGPHQPEQHCQYF